MNSILKNSGILLSTLILAACGSDDDHSHGDAHDEHEHNLLISQADSNVLSVLEEGTPESLDDTASGNVQSMLLANNGEIAAVLSAGTVDFVVVHEHEEEEEGEAHEGEEEHDKLGVVTIAALSSGVSQVTNTIGHFSVLVNNQTQLVPYSVFEEGGNPDSEALSLGIVEEAYPALLLEEGETETVTLAFDGTNAVVYEDTTATSDTTACSDVDSAAQNAEFAVVSCDDTTFSVKLEEGESDHTIEFDTTFTIATGVEWKTAGGVFVGLGADNQFYVLEENETTEVLELEGSFAATETVNEATVELCAWGIDSLEAEIFALTATELTIFDHYATSHSITLDETQGATCGDLRMATASQAVFVLDNNGAVLYEIDKEEGASQYHIHGRETLSVTDIESAVIFHEVGTDSHSHSHE